MGELDGIRDPDHPCSQFEETDYPLSITNDCKGDGHYMCRECAKLTNNQLREYAIDNMVPLDRLFVGLRADGSDPNRWRKKGRM